MTKDQKILEYREAIKELLEVCSSFTIPLPSRPTPTEVHHHKMLKKEKDDAVRNARVILRKKV